MKETKKWNDVIQIAMSQHCVVGLKKDGTVIYSGSTHIWDQSKPIAEWKNIVKLFYADRNGDIQLVGLRSDGRVEYCGNNFKGVLDVSTWEDIVDIAVSEFSTVGLKTDGRVVANFSSAGDGENAICQWDDIAVFN